MRAAARIAVARCGERNVVVDQRCAAPFSVRQCAGRILLASSAAAPVGGDELSLVIDVGPGARADVGSVAAGMVWPGATDSASSMATECSVGDGGHLRLRLEPTISVVGSNHRSTTVVRLDGRATCEVFEEVVLGRRSETSGLLGLALRVERDGRPLVSHEETFGPDVAGALSSVSIGAARFVLTAVVVGPQAGEPQVCVESDRAGAWLPVADDAGVLMAVGPDRPSTLALVARVSAAACRTAGP